MTNRVRIGVAALAAVLVGGLMTAQAYRQAEDAKKDKPDISGRLSPEKAADEEAAIRKVIDGLSAAYNKGDLDGVLAAWGEDAEFLAEDGKAHRGKDAIRVLMKKSLAANKGAKQSIRVTAVRFLRPDVAVESGTVTLTAPDGSDDAGPYEAIWMKLDGKWRISRVRDLVDPADADAPSAVGKLKPLAWLVGEWADKDGTGDVRMSCKWGPGQTFLLMEFVVKHADGKELTVSQRVGYDAAKDGLRSWVFDSAGGFGGGPWKREGNAWSVASEGTYPDGRPAASKDRWAFVNDGEFRWEAKDRTADEAPMPDVSVTFVKKGR